MNTLSSFKAGNGRISLVLIKYENLSEYLQFHLNVLLLKINKNVYYSTHLCPNESLLKHF